MNEELSGRLAHIPPFKQGFGLHHADFAACVVSTVCFVVVDAACVCTANCVCTAACAQKKHLGVVVIVKNVSQRVPSKK
jgi:hypothetical protein